MVTGGRSRLTLCDGAHATAGGGGWERSLGTNAKSHTTPPPPRALAWYSCRHYWQVVPTMKRVVNRNPRVQVTLSREVAGLLQELHDLTGQPKSALISDMLDQIAPAFATTVKALLIVQEQPREAQRLIQNMANEAIAQAAQGALDLDSTLDARTVKERRAKARKHGQS
jgi:hypothetical protein